MDTNASWEVWATRIISAASIVMLGYFLLFVDFSGHGRVWDTLAARVPVLAKIIPPAAASSATAVVKGGASQEQVVDRTLITAEPAAQLAAAVPAPAIAAAAPAVAKKTPTPNPHLTSSLSGFDAHSTPSQTSAALGAAPAAAQAASAAAPASAAAAQPQSAPSVVVAAKASYGAASRSEMMGQAAGPVYNLTGKKK